MKLFIRQREITENIIKCWGNWLQDIL